MLRYVIAFIAGGTAFTILAPILSSIAILMIIGLIILAILTAFIPGGWVIMFGFRSLIGFVGKWIIPLAILAIATLFTTVLTGTAGHYVGLGLSFVVGGLAGIMVVSRLSKPTQASISSKKIGSRIFAQYSQESTVESKPPKGWSIPVVVTTSLFGREAGILSEAFREGVVVMGEAAIPASRTLVKGAAEKGMRVVVIGSPYIAPNVEGVKLVRLGVTSFNIVSPESGLDGFSRRLWAENIAVPLVVAAGLDTAEAGMVVRFLQKFAGARLTPDDVDKIVAEYGPTSSARLKDAIGMLTTHFGEEYPHPSKLFKGEWGILVIDTSRLSQSLQLFTTMYLLYEAPNLFPGCIVVFDSAELGLPEQSLLPYDARHVWLRTLKAVERLKTSGFIIVASTGLLAPELLDIAGTYIVTRGPAHMRRALSERIGVEINPSAIPIGQAYVFTRVSRDGEPHLFTGRLIEVEHADIPRLEEEAEREATLLREEMLAPLRDTILYADFAEMAEKCYKVLRSIKSLATPTQERVISGVGQGSDKALKQLLEKGYILVDPAGVLGLTTLGEQAIKDWESRVKKAHTSDTLEKTHSQEVSKIAVQAGLQLFQQSSKPDMSEPSRLVVRAREALLKGEVLQAVGIAYKAAVRALKEATGTVKGHLPELAEKAVEKGILKLEDDEVRRLYAANIEAKRLSKQVAEGANLTEEDVRRMRDAAELLISLTERITAFFEKIPGGEVGEENA
jgi:MFS family permease